MSFNGILQYRMGPSTARPRNRPASAQVEGLRRALARAARALGRAWPQALEGDVDAVHDARVASRRIREIVPLLASAGVPGKLARRARRITRALGPVRELDVTLALLLEFEGDHQPGGDRLASLKDALERRRVAARDEMLERLRDFDASRFARRVRRAGDRVDEKALSGVRAAIASRLASRARQLSMGIEAAGTVYAPEPLHVLRIRVKKLRYTLEVARLCESRQPAPDLAPLKAAQEVLGRLHDLDVLAGALGRSPALEPPPASAHAIASLMKAVEHEERALHARYLKLRVAIAGLADESRRFALWLASSRRAKQATLQHEAEDRGKPNQPVPGAARGGGRARRRVS
jgi:CHAD domain-containing protein